jgi:hypothetical protein
LPGQDRADSSGFEGVFSLLAGIALGVEGQGQRPPVCLQALRGVTRFIPFEECVTELGFEIVDRRLCLGQRTFGSLPGFLF